MADRIYSEKEAAAILEGAARLQGVDEPVPSVGLTLTELEGVAATAGIERRHVVAAAQALNTHAVTPRARIVGFQAEATRTILLDRTVSDEQWGRIVADLRRAFGGVGITSDVGAVRAWASAGSESEVPVHASLEPEGAGARLTLTQRPGELVAVLTMIVVSGLAVLGGATLLFDADAGLLGTVLFVLATTLYAGVRFAYARWMRRTEAQFEEALARASGVVAAPAPAALADAGDEGSVLKLESSTEEDAARRTIGGRTRT